MLSKKIENLNYPSHFPVSHMDCCIILSNNSITNFDVNRDFTAFMPVVVGIHQKPAYCYLLSRFVYGLFFLFSSLSTLQITDSLIWIIHKSVITRTAGIAEKQV